MTALAPHELAVGYVLGEGAAAPLPVDGPADPVEALEAAMLPALLRPPCLVSFSGGRDSSAVLAVAAGAAARRGLEPPIPVTVRAPGAPGSEESEWQDRVMGHLGLDDWLRLDVGDELDAVGPIARAAMRRHGLLWPFNAHFHVPLLEAARGGSLLTGIGGDELFAAATIPRATAALTGRVRVVPRDIRRIALHAAPRPLRRWWHARAELPLPWLTPEGRSAVSAAFAAIDATEPRRLAARLAWLRGSAPLTIGPRSLDLLAADAGATIAHPLLDHRVWSAVARSAPRGGYLGRTPGMRALFGDLLPDGVLARESKAGFDEVFFARHSRAFAATWAGDGVPEGLVDAGALRGHWSAPEPLAQSFTLLQAAFLASRRERVEQEVRGVGQGVPAAGAAQPPDGQ